MKHKLKINSEVFDCISSLCIYQEPLNVQERNSKGQFVLKSGSYRQNRSIRTTDETWSNFGEIASYFGLSKGDLFHLLFSLQK